VAKEDILENITVKSSNDQALQTQSFPKAPRIDGALFPPLMKGDGICFYTMLINHWIVILQFLYTI